MQVSTIRNRKASAFTLIELLVVIAIIAILAAILFPVFAQARQQARGASSQSNLRQLSLGILMYVQDYDETFPMSQSWYKPGTGGHVNWGGGYNWSMWTFDIAPYLKNAQIFADPLYGPSGKDSFTQTYFPDYGYNYTSLSPSSANTSPWQFLGRTLAFVNFPSSTVLLTGISDSPGETGGGWSYGVPNMFELGNSEPPDCSDIPQVCWSDWAPNGNTALMLSGSPTEEAGLYTGGDSVRKSHTMNFSFTDGHCKFVQEGQGAVGTNWHHGSLSGTIHITDNNLYMWQYQ